MILWGSLRWSWQGLPPGAEAKEGPDHIVRMEANNIPAFQTEDYMPPPNELMSRVDFIYKQGSSEKDEASFLEKRSGRSGTENWRASSESARSWSRR